MTMMTNPRAKYGAEAYKNLTGDLPKPFPRTMGPNALSYLKEFVESGMNVSMIDRFEQYLAKMLGVKHCIATPGCTAALALLGEGLRFEPGDEVICSPISDYGTIAGVVKSGYIPVFADTDPHSVNLSAATIEPRITDRTRAILCVHKTGLMCDMDPIMALAGKHNLVVIEDACQAFGSTYKGRLAGTIGHFGAFSFDAEKTVGSDIGGALVTNHDESAEYCRFIGQSRGAVELPGYGRRHSEPGHAYRMPHCTAAVTLAQLEISQQNVDQRDRMIRLLTGLLREIPGVTPLSIPQYQEKYSAWMAGFSVDLEQFDCSLEELGAEMAKTGIPGISASRYYLLPEACTFLDRNSARRDFPYHLNPHPNRYHVEQYPNAKALLNRFLRWCTFCEKYTEAHCEHAARIVAQVASRHRR